MNNDFSNDVYAVEQILPISPAAQAAFERFQQQFYEQLGSIASMYGVTLSGYIPASSSLSNVQHTWRPFEKPTHKWAVKMFQEGKKPAILGFDTACSFADAVSNLGRIASNYPVTYDKPNRRYVGDGFFITIEVKEIANEKSPANQAHQR